MTPGFVNYYHPIATILGTAIEIAGVLWLANALFKIPRYQVPKVLASSLVNGEAAKSAAELKEVLPHEDLMKSYRGVALVLIGLLIKASGAIADFLH